MTFQQFAFNNVLRNKRTYAAYFLSSTFAVMVFFVYAIFAFHPALKTEDIHNTVSQGLHFAEAIIYVFSFIFVLFSMSSFLKTRKKEFGLLIMHGMTNWQLRKMVFLENVYLGFFATVSGIGLGLIFAKLILLIAEEVLRLDLTLHFYIPIQAIVLTFVAFFLLFVIISLVTVGILKENKLVDLIKGSVRPKKEPKASLFLSFVAFSLLAIGYIVALNVKGLAVVSAMIPVTIIVIIGTYFFFTQLSVYVVKALRNRRLIFWKKTNIVLFSDLAYRMKDNARTFFFVAIVSTVAFSAIGTLVGFRSLLFTSLEEENPFAFEYISERGNAEKEEHLSLIRRELNKADIPFSELTVNVKQVAIEGEKRLLNVVSESDYQKMGTLSGRSFEKVSLDENESAFVYYKNALADDNLAGTKAFYPLQSGISLNSIEKHLDLEIKQSFGTNLFPTQESYLIVSDERFKEFTQHFTESSYTFFMVKEWKNALEVSRKLAEVIPEWGNSHMYFSLPYTWDVFNQMYSATFFVGLFIGAVFFVAAGSFLYFRLYTDLEEEQRKFSIIHKLGLTEKELSKIVTVQLILLFFVPIVVAVIHGAVALTALQHMFKHSLVKESSLVLGSFFMIQVVYFLLIRYGYLRKIKQALS